MRVGVCSFLWCIDWKVVAIQCSSKLYPTIPIQETIIKISDSFKKNIILFANMWLLTTVNHKQAKIHRRTEVRCRISDNWRQTNLPKKGKYNR